ncbi:YbaB/EbfC family nucleoid-associated protein [Paractinoplanes atraurantiacus]|uniref:YbaB/EbfC DNA-binding family protein n=1 Tax=Paractinoplanes atraurantiacus TaxID=1036182 RepID=A0A285K669_9ACTN|nr:YbaB/EbfC family nucleoid-associated protein [Actinoplanes atraurantiacus]SNY67507.1 YbaB/EbfC DNA-binding family protein [Actinoplanes atraurantiacus]
MSDAERSLAALEQAIADYPRQLAETTERVDAAASATVTGQDEGGLVTVTASGAGHILAVRVSPRALRDLDARTVAARVAAAANAALARAEQSLAEAAGHAPADLDEERKMRAFEQRMDATMDRLDRLDRSLDRLLDQ